MQPSVSVPGHRPPVVLTFLAPAERCNQACPGCIIDRLGEPVRSFELSPSDYAQAVEQLVGADIPILSASFQGYEVTLPKSWPYVEAVFAVAKRHGIRRSFITNGMLLDRWADRIRALEPSRIAISLDGADPVAHDRLRGLPGAFLAATRAIGRFIEAAPSFRSRLSVASTLYDEANFRSLQEMPKLLTSLGVSRWVLGFELAVRNGVEVPVQSKSTLVGWLSALQSAAAEYDLRFHINDEFGFFQDGTKSSVLSAKGLFDPSFLLRVLPTGQVHVGSEVVREYRPRPSRLWHPDRNHISDVMGYYRTVNEMVSDPPGTPLPLPLE